MCAATGVSNDTSAGTNTFSSCVELLVADQLNARLSQTQAVLPDAKAGWEKLEAWLRTPRGQLPMLLIFESTEDVLIHEDSFKDFQGCWERLQAFPQVKLLAVSRMRVPLPHCATLELDKLSSSSAVDLLRNICEDPSADAQTLEKLADVCGHNATAMTLIGGFIKCRFCTAQEAITAAEEGGVMSIREDNKRHRIRDAREFQAIRVWLAKCVGKDELSMVARLSLFAGSFNAEGAAAIGKAPSQPLPLTPQREVAIMLEDMTDCAVLEAAILVCSAPCNEPAAARLLAPRYKMHALIREIAKDPLKELQGSGVQEARLAFVRQVHRALASIQHACTAASQQASLFWELEQLVLDLHGCGCLADAELIGRQNLIRHEAVLGQEHPDTLSSRGSHAVTLYALGKLEEAAQMQRQVLEAKQRVLGHEHPDTLRTVANLALALKGLGKLEEAAGMLRLLLDTWERVQGQEHPCTLFTMGHLAGTLCALGNLEEAAQMERQVLEASERVLGQEHLHTLMTRNNLAAVLLEMGKLEDAAGMLRLLLEDQKQVLGREHPNILKTKGNLAGTLHALGNSEEAAQMQRQVLDAQERMLGQEHPDTLLSRGILAVFLCASGKLEEGAQLLRQVLEAQERVLGQEHPDTLRTRGNLAGALLELGKLEDAAGMLRLLLEAQERILGHEHPHTLTTRSNLANPLCASGNFTEAAQMQKQLLEARERVLGREHPDTLMTRGNLAESLRVLGNLEEAAQM
ncbi:g11272 [Coccomyxa elongata]